MTLTGVVNARWKKIRAGKCARELQGISGVTNEVAVVPSESITDEFIAGAVMESLVRNLSVDATAVEVTVSERRVTLDGTVSSVPARSAAHTVALSTPGVTGVRNRLVVRTSGPPGPE